MNMKSYLQDKLPSMFTRIWNLLTKAHPSVEDKGERRRARLLSVITLILLGFLVWAMLSSPTSMASFIALTITTVVSYVLSRTRFYRIGNYIVSYGFASLTYLSLYFGTTNSFDTSISSTAHIAIIMASVLLSLRDFSILAAISIAATFSAPLYSHVLIPVDGLFFRNAGIYTIISLILAGAIGFRNRVERARLRELTEANIQLESITADLEDRVSKRTLELQHANEQTSIRAKRLQAITELSESIAQLQDLNELFPITTKLISERFGFYHIGIFLVDSSEEYAVLQAANSEGGKQMLASEHRLKLGNGVVGYAAQTGEPRIALDVGTDAVFFNNPYLPDTRSEVALPLKSRGKTIGVLDAQSTEAGAFTREDLQVLTALANQVAITFENTRLLTETRAALAQVQEVYNEFTRTEWTRAVSAADQPGFRYNSGRIEILEKELQSPEAISAVENGQFAANLTTTSEEKRATLAVPVKLRGEVIGVLHIESDNPTHEWDSDEISLVNAVAERASVAMENARLFQDARRRAYKEQLISEASAKISSAIDFENILQTTAEELERVLGGSDVLIRLQNKERS